VTDKSFDENVLHFSGVASRLKGGDAGPVTFNVDGGIKDMQSMLAEAKSRGIELPLVERTIACYEETKRQRSGGAEISTVSVYWANRDNNLSPLRGERSSDPRLDRGERG